MLKIVSQFYFDIWVKKDHESYKWYSLQLNTYVM